MTTKHIKPLIITIIFASIALFAFQFATEGFVFHRELITKGQIWRIVSGNFVHSNFPHLFLNLSGLWILAFLFIDSLLTKTFIFATLFLSLFIGICLFFFNPELIKYYGFSGVLYGLFVFGASQSILQKDYFTGISIIIIITGKIAWDQINGGNSSSEALIGIPVAIDAHLYGLIGAAIISIYTLFKEREIKKNSN